MKSTLAAFVAILALLGQDVHAGRFGGGGRGGGGGGFHGGGGGGGFHGGGVQRAGGYHGGAPMSRPQTARPAGGASTRQVAGHGNAVNGPYGGSVARPAGAGSRGNMTTAGGRTGSATGPHGGTAAGGWTGGSYTGPHGSVVVGGAKGGSVTGPGGNTFGGAKGGAAVIGPNGNVHATGGKVGGVVTPGGTAIAGSHGSITKGQNGVVASGGRHAAAVGPGGAAVAGGRGAVAVGPYGAAAAGRRTVAGRTSSGAFVGTRHVSAAALSGQGAAVRRGFGHYNAFTPDWRARYPGAWFAAGWAAGALWRPLAWGVYAPYAGYAAGTSPIYYDYGDNVTYDNGNVYYGDQVQATEDQYAQQAAAFAEAGRKVEPADEGWRPLGVFAMTRGDETTSNNVFQLAINKEGVLRGNFYNAVADTVEPVYGSLDKKTQRVAWSIGNKTNTVCETGLYNLTQDETTMLVHYGKDRTEQYNLFRIEQPDAAESAPG